MRIFLDTNIIISGIVFQGPERELLRIISLYRHQLILTNYILAEIMDVMHRKFPDKEAAIEAILAAFNVEWIPNPSVTEVRDAASKTRDRKDAVVLATVVMAKPDLFVSGDLDFHTPDVVALVKTRTTQAALEILRVRSGP